MFRSFAEILKYRYIIALICFFLGVSLNINGSSSLIWTNYGIKETVTGTQENLTVNEDNDSIKNWMPHLPDDEGIIFGIPRAIRSDEWLVQSSYFISQVNSDLNLINENYGESGLNMVVAYNSPVRHISIIGKPFNWGALFLDASHAMSWYWVSKVILYLLVSFEFLMILTQKNKFLSVLGSFAITYTPTIQWWFMQHLGDLAFFTMLAIVCIYHFFDSKRTLKKIIFASLLTISLIGFVLVIYPAFQVPFAYIIGLFFFVIFCQNIKNNVLTKIDFCIMGFSLLTVGLVIGVTLYQSWDALTASLGTVYPGSRVSTGGEIQLSQFLTIFSNVFLPFNFPNVLNQVELASSINFLPFMVILPFIFKIRDFKINWFPITLLIFCLVLAFYALLGIPVFVSKFTLFSFVTGNRAWQAMSVIAVWVTIWFVDFLWKNLESLRYILPLTLFILLILGIFTLRDTTLTSYISTKLMLLSLLIYGISFVAVLFKKKSLFVTLFLGMIFVSGFTVNPIVKGLDIIDDRSLSKSIKEIVNNDPEGTWVTDSNMLYNFPQMFGADSIDGVRFYPDFGEMNILDPEQGYEENWNRYSHVKVSLTTGQTTFSNSSPDVLDLGLNEDDLQKLGVDYVLTQRELEQLSSKFQLIYGPDKDGNRIYRFLGE
ncbi:DUF7657 domain-containing protein [Streptococcus caprae]|uniref:Glycosyltransferase RgtA/B/C/D-like domain-containing protein n=1 Tax=Streptococcus caprae TaxID=1640501 RepID=A0ABV8CV87_9STRE